MLRIRRSTTVPDQVLRHSSKYTTVVPSLKSSDKNTWSSRSIILRGRVFLAAHTCVRYLSRCTRVCIFYVVVGSQYLQVIPEFNGRWFGKCMKLGQIASRQRCRYSPAWTQRMAVHLYDISYCTKKYIYRWNMAETNIAATKAS
jgi:hypothetical protein